MPVAVDSSEGALLSVRVTPRGGRSAVTGVRDGRLLLRLAAPPVEGAANAALVEFLADVLDVPRRAIAIRAGARARDKRLVVASVPARIVNERLRRLIP